MRSTVSACDARCHWNCAIGDEVEVVGLVPLESPTGTDALTGVRSSGGTKPMARANPGAAMLATTGGGAGGGGGGTGAAN